jgi:bis(5'-nucleosyl)-tetraphosphatase (symmetrical)
MATFAIGDVHGCYDTLQALLRRIRFDRRNDRLWMVGDLVNRGPGSVAVLRWAAELDDRLTVVLGNHDLHLLARAMGVGQVKRRDTLEEVLEAHDAGDLLAWLRARPLLHQEDDHVLVHAGLFPAWSLGKAGRLAREVEGWLRGDGAPRLVETAERKTPERWQGGQSDWDRARTALAGFAKLRTLQEDGRMCPDFSGLPADAPKGCIPWFADPARRSSGAFVIFGHWAALGLRLGDGIAALDTGCVWGRCLTALRLDDHKLFQEPAVERALGIAGG